VITHRIRDFVGSDWRAARMAKDSYWGERVARLGPAEAWRVAEELRQQTLLPDRLGPTSWTDGQTSWRTCASPPCFNMPIQPAALELLADLAPVAAR
jgi:hypothetical protein